jgi:hypothetical protein
MGGDETAAYMGLAAMLAELHILILCNVISHSPGRTFIVQLLYISSSFVFQLGLTLWAERSLNSSTAASP